MSAISLPLPIALPDIVAHGLGIVAALAQREEVVIATAAAVALGYDVVRDRGSCTTSHADRMPAQELAPHFLPARIIATLCCCATLFILMRTYESQMLSTIARTTAALY